MTTLDSLELRFALDALVNQIPRRVTRDDGTTATLWDDCLLDQLEEASISSGDAAGGAAGYESKLPVPLNVLALKVEIRNEIGRYWVAQLGAGDTASQLRSIVDSVIRCDQGDSVREWTHTLKGWVSRIRDLSGVDRPRARPLPIECPLCQRRWQYVDADDEVTRRPILTATFQGDEVLSIDCATCGSWPRGEALNALVDFMRAA